jgi:uncharacterized heparinase superfamily protein
VTAGATRLGRYWHTLRYLRPIQIWRRLRHRITSTRLPPATPQPRRAADGPFVATAARAPSMTGPQSFRFLNEERSITAVSDWDRADVPLLWLYNLHYFDDLAATDAAARTAWHGAIIERWRRENPAPRAPGWDPYPVSLRIVNWIKAAITGLPFADSPIASLAQQARWLSRRIEWHLLGNHLIANAKALLYAGLFFEGPEADRWLAAAQRIMLVELGEQCLRDGGHFERSPMYHSIILEDVLDMINAARHWPGVIDRNLLVRLEDTAARMLSALQVMRHPDGEIGLFNDAAFGVAPTPSALADYASRLDIIPNDLSLHRRTREGAVAGRLLEDTGYARVATAQAVLIVDVAPIGPDYLPGHAHADTLAFELSLSGQRLFVNGGTSRYGLGDERLWERQTASHNTVTVDNEDSSEVWSGFRVARRAYPRERLFEEEDEAIRIACCHDGYCRLSGRPLHCRRWRLSAHELVIEDELRSSRRHGAVARFKLHPAIRAQADSPGCWTLALPGGGKARFSVEQGRPGTEAGRYASEFGKVTETTTLTSELIDNKSRATLRW